MPMAMRSRRCVSAPRIAPSITWRIPWGNASPAPAADQQEQGGQRQPGPLGPAQLQQPSQQRLAGGLGRRGVAGRGWGAGGHLDVRDGGRWVRGPAQHSVRWPQNTAGSALFGLTSPGADPASPTSLPTLSSCCGGCKRRRPTSAPVAAAAAFSGEPGESLPIDVAATPFKVTGGVRAFKPASPGGGTLEVKLRGSMLGKPGKFGELLFDLRKSSLARVSWGNRTTVSAELRVSPEFLGQGKRNWSRPHRARLFLVDARGQAPVPAEPGHRRSAGLHRRVAGAAGPADHRRPHPAGRRGPRLRCRPGARPGRERRGVQPRG